MDTVEDNDDDDDDNDYDNTGPFYVTNLFKNLARKKVLFFILITHNIKDHLPISFMETTTTMCFHSITIAAG